MRSSRQRRLLLLLVTMVAIEAQSQIPFSLDTLFRTGIDQQYVSSILPVADGDIILSGQIKLPGDASFRSGARLNSDGTPVASFPAVAYMGGKLVPWNDRVYTESGDIVRRVWESGGLDAEFISLNLGPYFSSLQGGDYHVFPDGRVLLSGRHILNDPVRDFVGPYCLCWFSNTGYLDTTRIHRPCSGVLFQIRELPDGKFIGSGTTSSYDNQAASNIFRFNADGSFDPSFQANVEWGQAYGFLPLEDGRVYAAGVFRITGVSDTLRLVRFMPDGSLDPSFNNHLHFEAGELTTAYDGTPTFIHQLDDERLIVTGGFHGVDGQLRKGLCTIDTSGDLLPDYFSDCGAGTYVYQGATRGSVNGIVPTTDGDYYIWGSFHEYDDGAVNDTAQRMVCRLYGLDVGVPDGGSQDAIMYIRPNPTTGHFTVEFADPLMAQSYYSVYDALGKLLYQRPLLAGATVEEVDLSRFGSGTYVLKFTEPEGTCYERVVVE